MQSLHLPQHTLFDTLLNPHTLSDKTQLLQSFNALENACNALLPQRTDELITLKMRRLLGTNATALSDEQIQCITTEFQFLIDAWLDEFEKDIFSGMTLREVVNEI